MFYAKSHTKLKANWAGYSKISVVCMLCVNYVYMDNTKFKANLVAIFRIM